MATQHDRNTADRPAERDGLAFHAPDEAPLRLSGLAWYPEEFRYRRLRHPTARPISNEVEALAWNTAGAQCSWRSDSGRVTVELKVAYDVMDHFTQIATAGVDLYVGEPGNRRFAGVSRFTPGAKEFSAQLFNGEPGVMREFTLNFPLYARVESLFIGLDSGAAVAAPAPWGWGSPVVVYGTSIAQGGCASRPGMAYTNILGRRLNRPVLNFGFSGAGKGESAMADELALIADPALYLLDYEPNISSVEEMEATLPGFIRILRAAHPETPILVMSRSAYLGDTVGLPGGAYPPASAIGGVMRRTVEELLPEDGRLYFFDGRDLFGTQDPDECTVDGVHATDLGFYRMAEALTPALKLLLKQ